MFQQAAKYVPNTAQFYNQYKMQSQIDILSPCTQGVQCGDRTHSMIHKIRQFPLFYLPMSEITLTFVSAKTHLRHCRNTTYRKYESHKIIFPPFAMCFSTMGNGRVDACGLLRSYQRQARCRTQIYPIGLYSQTHRHPLWQRSRLHLGRILLFRP